MYVAHLSLVDFRSYAAAEVALEPGVTAFVGRNGQGKTNLVEAIDYLSRLGSHRVATDAPLVRAGAAACAGPSLGGPRRPPSDARDRDQPRQGEPGPGQPRRPAAGPRAARAGPDRDLRARGPGPGQGRPGRAPALPRRPAGDARTAAGRRTRRLRAGPQAAQLPAQDRRRRTPRVHLPGVGALDPRRVGLPPRPHRRRAARRAAAAGRGAAAATSATPTRRWRAGRPATTRVSTTSRASRSAS